MTADHRHGVAARKQTVVVPEVGRIIRPAWVAKTSVLVLLTAFVAYVAASFLLELLR